MKIIKTIKNALGFKEIVKGLLSDDMTLAQLKQVCKLNNLDIKGLETKLEILKVVKKAERVAFKKMTEGTTLRRVEVDTEELGFCEGKRIISRKDVTRNGRGYTDITVEGGITYTFFKR